MVLDLSTPAGWLFWGGAFVLAIGVIVGLANWFGGKTPKGFGWAIALVVVGFVVLLVGQGTVGYFAPASSTNVQPAPSSAAITSYVSTTGFPSGGNLTNALTWNQGTATVQGYLVYNSTSGALVNAAKNGSTYKEPNYLVLPIHSARTDPVNQTYLFTYTVASVSTFQSLGTSPTTCSFIGFTQATSTQTGQWGVYWDHGQNANQKGQQNAPSVASNVAPDPTAIQGFGAVTNGVHLSLAGGNGTAFGGSCMSAVSLYTTYTETISIGNSNPSVITLDLSVVAIHA